MHAAPPRSSLDALTGRSIAIAAFALVLFAFLMSYYVLLLQHSVESGARARHAMQTAPAPAPVRAERTVAMSTGLSVPR